MYLRGSFYFRTDQQSTWGLLMDTDAIAEAIPGLEAMKPSTEAHTWHITTSIQATNMSGRYTGSVHISDQKPPDHYQLTIYGEGPQSIINASIFVKLKYNTEISQTVVSWNSNVSITGRLAEIDQQLTTAAAHMMAKRFFKALAEQLPQDTKPLIG